MVDRLSLDTGVLREAGASLRSVASEFDGANATSDQIAAAVGHSALASTIRHFAHGWDDRRAGMVEQIAGLADACTGIGDSFDQLDTEFAAALKGDT